MERGQRRSEPVRETTMLASARQGFAMLRGAGGEGSALAPGGVYTGEENSPSGVSVASVLLTCCFVFKYEDLRLSVGFPSATGRGGAGLPKALSPVPFLHHV